MGQFQCGSLPRAFSFLLLVLPVNHLNREIGEIVVSLSFLPSHLASLVFIFLFFNCVYKCVGGVVYVSADSFNV